MSLKFVAVCKTNEEYKATIMDAPPTTLCVVDCYASWCGPCDALSKKIGNLYQDMIECAAATALRAEPMATTSFAVSPAVAAPREPLLR